MRIIKYIKSQRGFILFYVVVISFISAVVYVDRNLSVSTSNILYINFVSYSLLLLYLTFNFIVKRRYYNALDVIANNDTDDISTALPYPTNYEEELINDILFKVFKHQNKKIEKLYLDKVENMEFVTSWVHEIKTPIAVSRLTIENAMGEPTEETLDSIEEELFKIDNYVEQALYYSKIDDFSKDYFINEISIDTILKGLIKKNAKSLIGKRIRFSMKDTEIDILTDKKWLSFVIDQVLSNAVKYTPSGGTLEIYCEKNADAKRLIIKDSGIGIPPEDINRVFDKGFTGNNGRVFNQSTGMGLYLAKKMCHKLGHNIKVESELNKYTKVIIEFPNHLSYFNVTKV